MKKLCALYLRVKVKSHNELAYTESEDFLEVISMGQTTASGGSGSNGAAGLKNVEASL